MIRIVQIFWPELTALALQVVEDEGVGEVATDLVPVTTAEIVRVVEVAPLVMLPFLLGELPPIVLLHRCRIMGVAVAVVVVVIVVKWCLRIVLLVVLLNSVPEITVLGNFVGLSSPVWWFLTVFLVF